MKREVIQTLYADKTTVLSLIGNILKLGLFCGDSPVDLHRIDQLLKSLEDNLLFVVEYPYTDSHYRDCYYFYHAAKFDDLPRETLRVHIFSNAISNVITDIDALLKKSAESEDSVSELYYGFFIVRPLNKFPLGRSLISPVAFKKRGFCSCLIKERVYLLGMRLTVHAFPHVAQDTETHTCAESSLWILLNYYGAKYKNYQTLLPSDIIRHLNNVSTHRTLPSNGLTVKELSRVLTQDGHNCVLYTKNTDKDILQIMRIYIESGIPLIVALENDKSGHAIVAIGHEDKIIPIPSSGWSDICEGNRNIVFMDDNMSPYQLADAHCPTKHYDNNLSDMEIKSLVVPLQKHMFLEAGQAYKLIKEIFDDKNIGLSNYGGCWQTRLLLTSGRAFKNSLMKDTVIAPATKLALLKIKLPKFVWLCEIYRENNLRMGHCDGIVLLDSTGDRHISSVIIYLLEDKHFHTDGIKWLGYRPIIKFEKQTYRHNLKGAWNKWKI